jgi:hypothetical protein
MSKSNAPIIIPYVSRLPYLSLGIRSGGIVYNGFQYYYFKEHDVYIRKDYQAKFKKHKKEGKSFDEFVNIIKNEQNNS